MTMFSTFTGSYQPRTETLFCDFMVDTHPFAAIKSTGSTSAITVSNENGSYSFNPTGSALGPKLGIVNLVNQNVASAGIFNFCGVYMSSAQAENASPNKAFKVGHGAIEVSARFSGVAVTSANEWFSFGIGSCDHDTTNLPSTDFIGFFKQGGQSFKCGTCVNGTLKAVNVSVDPSSNDLRNYAIRLNRTATKILFLVDDKVIYSDEISPRTSIGMIPFIEVKSVTANTGSSAAVAVDWMSVELETDR